MTIVQPPLIGKYFAKKIKPSKQTFYKSFYLSWEDAVWHLLKIHKLKKGAVAMVPQFYCGNVILHMQNHGLKVVTYPVDKNLITNSQIFKKLVVKTKPDILIIFHAIGIQNQLITNYKKWITSLPLKSILIEDCVHRVIDPNRIKFISKNHYLIDSLRKVVPVQGSFVYSANILPKISMLQVLLTIPYRTSVFVFWFVMQIFLMLAYYSKNTKLEKIFSKLAEQSMLVGYNIIGSNRLASPGISLMKNISENINYAQIYKTKNIQAKIYLKNLIQINGNKFWFPKIQSSDYHNLRGFPIILDIKIADKFVKYIRDNGVLIRFELNDCTWSEKQKIVYLPMGLHVKQNSIIDIVKIVSRYKF